MRELETIYILHPESNNEYKLTILSPFHTTCNTPGVRLAFWALALHEPKHHLFIYEHGTYVMH
jgi:hypothetical protein